MGVLIGRRGFLALGGAAVASSTLTACLGSVTENELTAEVFRRGGGFTDQSIVDALARFAEHAGYADVKKLRLRSLSLTSIHAVNAEVSFASNPDECDLVSWDGRGLWTSPSNTEPSPYFLPADVPAMIRDPRAMFLALTERVGEPAESFSLTASLSGTGGGSGDRVVPSLAGAASTGRSTVNMSFDPATGAGIGVG